MGKRGPNTPRSRAAVRHDAVKPCPACPPLEGAPRWNRGSRRDGLTSGAPVIPVESHAEWQRFLDGIIAGYEPEGQLETEQHRAKKSALDRWVRAVNYHGGFGRRAFVWARDPNTISGELQKLM